MRNTSKRQTRFVTAIGLSCVLFLSGISGCGIFKKETQNPYLREALPAYTEQGTLDPETIRIPVPYLEHMLKDLDACYGDTK